MTLPPGKQIGRYQLRELIGSGGTASAYLAFDPTFERYVAIKLMHPSFSLQDEFRKRFLREAQATARLRHPSIIEVFDYGQTDDNQLYIVMELVRGPNLETLLTQWRAEQRQLPLAEAVSLMRQLAEATAYANEQGVLHRDLKPANILLKPRWPKYAGEMLPYDPLITDFGLARLEGGADITTPGVSIGGTPAYMAPEQLDNEPLDERSDLYSLGVIFYQLVTGQLPFQLKTLHEALRQHAVNSLPLQPPQQLRPDLPNELNALIIQTLEPDRNRRLPSLQALVQALRELSEYALPIRAVPDRALHDHTVPDVTVPDLTVASLADSIHDADLTVADLALPDRARPREVPTSKTPSQFENARVGKKATQPLTSVDPALTLVATPPARRNLAVMGLSAVMLVVAAALLWYFIAKPQDANGLSAPPATTVTSQAQATAASAILLTDTAVASTNPTATTNAALAVTPTLVASTLPITEALSSATAVPSATNEPLAPSRELLASVIGPNTAHPTQLWIDGDLTDWQVLRALSKSQTATLDSAYDNQTSSGCQARYPGSSAVIDLAAQVQFAHDTKHLYVSFLVQDDGYIANSEFAKYGQGDAIQLLFKMPAPSADTFQLDLLPGIDQPGDRPAAAIRSLSPPGEPRLAPEISVAAVTTADGYFLEAALPWTLFGTPPPQTGAILGVAPNVTDNDTPSTQVQECLLSAVPNYKQDDPASWATLEIE